MAMNAGGPVAEELPCGPLAGEIAASACRAALPAALLSWARAFPGTPQQAQLARRFAADRLIGSPLRGDAVVILSELFSNAVLHTRSGEPGGVVTVQVSRWRLGARIAVADQGAAAVPVLSDAAAAAAEPSPNGRGLLLVSALATHLAWHGDDSGRTACAVLGKLPGIDRDGQAAGGR